MRKNYQPLWSQPSKYVAPSEQRSPLQRRQAQFDALNAHVTAEGGWVTSVRGSSTFRFEAPRGSKLPTKLRLSGYELQEIEAGSRMRLVPNATGEQLSLLSSGAFGAVERSTRPGIKVEHASEVRVDAYEIVRGIA